jgi:hypothetical protein
LTERGLRQAMRVSARGSRPSGRLAVGLRSLALLAGLTLGGFHPGPASADTVRQLAYDVKHSVFGDIGTYTNVIETSGAMITIKTTAHFLVTALGIGLHREDASRTEQWQGDRLIAFHGITKKNGDTTEVQGKAEGNNFVITGPLGQITAPGSVKPANPWSTRSIDSTAMMRVDTGKVEQVKVSGGGQTNVNIDGASTTAKEYDISGSTHYKIWFDQHDIPVMFVVDDDSGQVTFTLKK